MIENELKSIDYLLNNNLPKSKFDVLLKELISSVGLKKRAGLLTDFEIEKIRDRFPVDFLNGTLHGHGFEKPYGYAGDFMLIDFIYQKTQIADQKYLYWDDLFQNQIASKAVRNRKSYFKYIVAQKLRGGTKYSFRTCS